MGAPAWCANYVGMPYLEAGRDPVVGLDCWGLLVHVMRTQFNLPVPLYSEHQWEGRSKAQELARFIMRESSVWTCIWKKSEPNEVLTDWSAVRPGDGLLIRMDGAPVHVGVVAELPWFLHTEVQMDCCLDEVTSPKWARRILGVYRFEAHR